jgi:hypothetical protein
VELPGNFHLANFLGYHKNFHPSQHLLQAFLTALRKRGKTLNLYCLSKKTIYDRRRNTYERKEITNLTNRMLDPGKFV